MSDSITATLHAFLMALVKNKGTIRSRKYRVAPCPTPSECDDVVQDHTRIVQASNTMPQYKRQFSSSESTKDLNLKNQLARRKSDFEVEKTQEPVRDQAFKKQRISTFFNYNTSNEDHSKQHPLPKTQSCPAKKRRSLQDYFTLFLTKIQTLKSTTDNSSKANALQDNVCTDLQEECNLYYQTHIPTRAQLYEQALGPPRDGKRSEQDKCYCTLQTFKFGDQNDSYKNYNSLDFCNDIEYYERIARLNVQYS